MNYDRLIERNVEYWGHCKVCGLFHSQTPSFIAQIKKVMFRRTLSVQNKVGMYCSTCWKNLV